MEEEKKLQGQYIPNEHERRIYYKKLFPVEELCAWLTYGNDPDDDSKDNDRDCLVKREFSFTFEDAYLRYQGLPDVCRFRDAIAEYNPLSINIGACYNHPMNRKGSIQSFSPVWKEFVLDLDLSDYDPVRACCSKESSCSNCWSLMTTAIRCVHEILTVTLGYENVLWVYSGRRGVHCWVCDSNARSLSDEGRTSLIRGMNLFPVEGNVLTDKECLHPMISRMIEHLQPVFLERVKTQRLFSEPRIAERLLSVVPSPEIRASVLQFASRTDDGLAVWAELRRQVNEKATFHLQDKGNERMANKLRSSLDGVIAEATAPRFDVGVSTRKDHLLKSPFCVHPKTGRICVPIDPTKPFDAAQAPTLPGLIQDLDARKPETTLGPYLRYFSEFLSNGVFPGLRKNKKSERVIKFLGE